MRNAKHTFKQCPPYAIPYGCGIPNPIYGYGYGVGIMRPIRVVVDMRSEIGEWGSEKNLCMLPRSKPQNDPINISHAPKWPETVYSSRSGDPEKH